MQALGDQVPAFAGMTPVVSAQPHPSSPRRRGPRSPRNAGARSFSRDRSRGPLNASAGDQVPAFAGMTPVVSAQPHPGVIPAKAGTQVASQRGGGRSFSRDRSRGPLNASAGRSGSRLRGNDASCERTTPPRVIPAKAGPQVASQRGGARSFSRDRPRGPLNASAGRSGSRFAGMTPVESAQPHPSSPRRRGPRSTHNAGALAVSVATGHADR